jgi:hypothetical protein
MASLPQLPDDLEETRASLHAYAHAVGAIPREHAAFHPRWWHISLKVRPDGLVTEAFPLPDGGSAFIRMDLRSDLIVFATSHGDERDLPMNAGLTATEMGDALIAAASEFGLEGEYNREKFENDDPRVYDPAVASGFFDVLVAVDGVFTEHRNLLGGEVGPIQLWPHGFDLAFEWFGTRKEVYEEDGEVTEHPSQLNLGFYPAGRAYLYSNPWPFEGAKLIDVELPSGAQWNTEGWEGSILHYDEIQADPDATEAVLAYAKAVYAAAAPTLTA